MEFIRENLLKIVVFVILLIVAIIIFTMLFGGKRITRITDYPSMEQRMVESAQKYVNKNQKLLPNNEDETSKVNLDTLVNAGYMNELSSIEEENIKCNGHVEVIMKNKNYQYIPYLKCGKYYETQTIADYIRNTVEVTTTGDGLYQVGNKLVYKGENPNNYLGIGNRLYRIVDINEEGVVKLISVKKIQSYILWDDRYNTEKNRSIGINDYSKSRLKDYLAQFLEIGAEEDERIFSDAELEKMSEQDLCIGKRPSTLGDISDANECQKVLPNQKVALLTVSDFARASVDTNCKSIFDKSCMNYNYVSSIAPVTRTITGVADNTYQVYVISDGEISMVNANKGFTTNIVINIDRLSLYKSGSGTFKDPYTIR